MTRIRLICSFVLTGVVLAGPDGSAMAEDETSPSPSPGLSAETANQPPVANPDQAVVEAGRSVTVDVLANDTDDGLGRPDGEPPRLDVVAARGPDGQVEFTATDVTFSAAPDNSGTVVVTYDVFDGELTSSGQLAVQVTAATKRSVSISMAQKPVTLKSYAIKGEVAPLTTGRADVTVQRRTPDGWVGQATSRTDLDGRYSVTFRTDQPGERTFRTVAVWADGRRARSTAITRMVRAVANPVVSGPLTARDVPHSWRSGCPVPPSQLRMIHINRFNYKKRVARGTIVVRATATGDIVKVLRAAFNARFPIRSLKPADAYYDGGRRTPSQSDLAAMRAGNTSAFNCRSVTGNPYRVSQHSYGNAIDINTIENPYVTGSRVYPEGSRGYLDRSPYRRGMIMRGGAVADKMRTLGWLWGARWSHPDYQHFSSNGG